MSRQNDSFVGSFLDTSAWLDYALDWMQKNMNPDDVFTPKQLQNWAEENGYTEEKEEK